MLRVGLWTKFQCEKKEKADQILKQLRWGEEGDKWSTALFR